jgi:CBS domain containing-hemolysin-like protein/Holliday junction resolvase-like predicted endonuclease
MNGYLIAIIALVLCSTFFSGTETAFSSVNKIKMKNLAAEDNKRAAIVLDLTENFDKLITTILVGNTIANIAMTTIATVYGIQTWGARIGPTLATVMVTILVLVLGEISPKIIAREYAEEVALFLAPFVKALIIIMTPLTFIFMGLKVLLKKIVGKNTEPEFSEDELLTIVEEAEAGGAIGEEQSELIANAIEFNDVEAMDILTPRVDIVAIEKGTPVAEIKQVFKDSGLSRLPVYEDDLDSIIGVLNQKDFYNNNVKNIKDTEKIIKPVAYVAETIKAAVLLRKMQADYDTYSGRVLERYFRQKHAETGQYNYVTNYWERDGRNEIDLIAVDDAERQLVIGEVKRQSQRLDMHQLKEKAANIVAKQRRRYTITFLGLSMDDM